jgi:hypothetical protein
MRQLTRRVESLEEDAPRLRSPDELLGDAIVTRIHEVDRLAGNGRMGRVAQALYLDSYSYPDATYEEMVERVTNERCPSLGATREEIEAYLALCEEERRRFSASV